jgi:hypothetical protein
LISHCAPLASASSRKPTQFTLEFTNHKCDHNFKDGITGLTLTAVNNVPTLDRLSSLKQKHQQLRPAAQYLPCTSIEVSVGESFEHSPTMTAVDRRLD